MPADHAWDGQLELGDRWATWRGSVGDSVAHRHLAAQIAVADTPIGVRDAAGRRHEARVVLIDPLVQHRFESHRGARMIFVEAIAPGLDARRALADLGPVPDDAVVLASTDPRLRTWRSPAPIPSSDLPEALRRSLARVEQQLAEGPVPLVLAAKAAGLSPERYRHVFVESLGLPFRRYLLWRRVQRAFAAMTAGAGVTTAAHAAGFADAAHFARTLKAMFGVTATQIVRPGPT
ncbi:DNA-binding domain-containing protein, AraC-type [Caulobacter sp. AP07]|uniref:helix-turn-helix domain-containing protein n=1 Tax=Caulobacter sp. AP07 TaxID=1144304 RepID=UPI000271E933|nr:helix-turn-helix domain-containing protein [Caulobacter sp. AP07]EJL23599.1 DNA-binding domain-containing protein, AraC-type [Caulobacter sp. AP07]